MNHLGMLEIAVIQDLLSIKCNVILIKNFVQNKGS